MQGGVDDGDVPGGVGRHDGCHRGEVGLVDVVAERLPSVVGPRTAETESTLAISAAMSVSIGVTICRPSPT